MGLFLAEKVGVADVSLSLYADGGCHSVNLISIWGCVMALSPEIQAAVVKVAGKWALETASRRIALNRKQKWFDLLESGFEESYHIILKTVIAFEDEKAKGKKTRASS